jgi:hypothetical protein
MNKTIKGGWILLIGLISTAAVLGADTTRIYFIGNSFTYHLPPDLVDSFARERGISTYIETDIIGGSVLKDHWNAMTSRTRIGTGNFDYVVLQDYRVNDPASEFDAYADSFYNLVQSAGSTPIFYMTWSYRDQKPVYDTLHQSWLPSTQYTIKRIYLDKSDELNAFCVPVGLAFDTITKEQREFPLWYSDGYHQSAEGGYLGACVFFASIFGQDPAGLTSYRTNHFENPTIDSVTRTYLQHMAWITVNRPELEKYIPYKNTTEAHKGFVPEKNRTSIVCLPNPFNPNISLVLAGPFANAASIKILDINGKIVADLSDRISNGRVHWNAFGAASGVYVAVVRKGDLKLTKKLILSK